MDWTCSAEVIEKSIYDSSDSSSKASGSSTSKNEKGGPDYYVVMMN